MEEKTFLEQFHDLTSNAEKIAVIGHIKPDMDCIASAVGVKWHMDNLQETNNKFQNAKTDIYISGTASNELKKIPYFETITFVPDIKEIIQNYDLLIFVDNCEFNQFSFDYKFLEQSSIKKIIIDHHAKSSENTDLTYVKDYASSCSQLIYKLFLRNEELPKDLYELIYLGIWSDTGSFVFVRSENTEAYDLAGEIVKKGNIYVKNILFKYTAYSVEVFNVVQELVKNQYFYNLEGYPGFMVSFVSREFMSANPTYTKEFVSSATRNYLIMFSRVIEGYPVAVAFKPQPVGWNMSLRSEGSMDVKEVLEAMGIGSGHHSAGSGDFRPVENEELTVEDCFNKFIEFLKTHKEFQTA